jgi:hypothetical protein
MGQNLGPTVAKLAAVVYVVDTLLGAWSGMDISRRDRVISSTPPPGSGHGAQLRADDVVHDAGAGDHWRPVPVMQIEHARGPVPKDVGHDVSR